MTIEHTMFAYHAPDVECIRVDAIITGFAYGVLTLAVLVAAWEWLA